MFLESFRITVSAVAQIFILGAIGFFLVKRDILDHEGLGSLSRMVIDVTLPILIFCQLLKDFSFSLYPNWWIFPLISIVITIAGLVVALVFVGLVKGEQQKMQFASLVTFQNSGYLPLALLAALLPPDKLGTVFIYLFLFLSGFNLVMFSLGVQMLSFRKNTRFELASLFSPPVGATILGLIFVYFGWNRFVPEAVLKPLKLVGDCTLPLAMFVVGANLAEMRLTHINRKEMLLCILAKLIVLPALGLLFLAKIKLPELIGLLIIMELAMPPATLLSVITQHYKKDDLLVSQGIFLGHLASIITIPLFLSLFFSLQMRP